MWRIQALKYTIVLTKKQEFIKALAFFVLFYNKSAYIYCKSNKECYCKMKIWIIDKKRGLFIIACFLIFVGVIIAGKEGAITASSGEKILPIYSVDKGEEKVISFTFDAAWGNEDTQKLIDIFQNEDIKVTFFVVGDWADNFPESVKALSDAGHEVMNHSNTHPHMPKLSAEKMKDEISDCNDKIEKITGTRPILFRAPYGDYNNNVVKTVEECGCYCIQWDVDSLDWKDLQANEIEERVLKKVAPGSIVLFHNAAKHTPEALPGLIKKLKEEGYSFVPVSQLVYADNYEIDYSGKQHIKKEN